MSTPAQITSTEAVRQFKLALEEFQVEAREAVTQLLLEMRRAVDWIEHDRARYWPHEMQRASDAVLQARNDLERCEMSIREEDKRSCYEQKLALEKAKRRLRLTEDKVRAVRRWRVAVHREADDFHGRLAKLASCLDMDLPRALATLERMAVALDRYTERAAPVESPRGWTPPCRFLPTRPAPRRPAPASRKETPDEALRFGQRLGAAQTCRGGTAGALAGRQDSLDGPGQPRFRKEPLAAVCPRRSPWRWPPCSSWPKCWSRPKRNWKTL